MGVCTPPPRGAGVGVTEGKGSQPEGPHPADCRHTCPSPSAETGPCLELTHSWLLSKQLWGQKRWGSPCPWVTPVTVGRAHLGGRWLTVRAPARGEAPSPQWQGCEEQVGHLLTAPGSQVPHAIPVSSRPRALGRGGPWAEGPGPLPSLPAAADPTEVLWARGVGVPEVGGEAWRQARLLGEGHTCWRGRGCTCWVGQHMLRGEGHTCWGGPHLLEGEGPHLLVRSLPTRLHSPFPPSLTPHQPPWSPPALSGFAQGWTWVPVDLWGPETRTQALPGWASGGTR